MGRGVETASSTPCLDLAVPLPKPRGEVAPTQGTFLIGLVIAATTLTLLAVRFPLHIPLGHWIELAFGNTLSFSEPFAPLFVLVMFFVAVAVHECGHLLAGLAVGFRLHSLRVGPFSLVRDSGRWHLTARRNVMDGLTAMEIVRISRLHRRMFLYLAAGPGCSFGVALAAAILLLVFRPGSWLGLGLMSLAVFSLPIAAINFFRHGWRGVSNDGDRLRMLARSHERTRRWMAINALVMQAAAGLLPRKWNRRWLTCATMLHDASVDALAANWLAYVAWSDANNANHAALHLERCLELTALASPDVRELLTLEAAIFTAWFRCDSNKAAEWLRRVRHTRYIPPLMRIRAEVALDCANQDFNGALSKWRRGQDLIESLPEGTAHSSSHHRWSEWLVEIRARQDALTDGVLEIS